MKASRRATFDELDVEDVALGGTGRDSLDAVEQPVGGRARDEGEWLSNGREVEHRP